MRATTDHNAEIVIERGTSDEGVSFVITEKPGYPTAIRTRYNGDKIPARFKEVKSSVTKKK